MGVEVMESLLQQLCDFDTLLALDAMIGKKEREELCGLVRKRGKGGRREVL